MLPFYYPYHRCYPPLMTRYEIREALIRLSQPTASDYQMLTVGRQQATPTKENKTNEED